MNATKRPLHGNGEPMAITATSLATAQTIFTSRAANLGWDEIEIYAYTTGGNRNLFLEIGGVGGFQQQNIQGNTSPVLILPYRHVVRGALSLRAYASGASTGPTIYIYGTIIEVRQ